MAQLERKRLLIVDDNEYFLSQLLHALNQDQIDVDLIWEPQDLLQLHIMLKVLESKPDLVLVDLNWTIHQQGEGLVLSKELDKIAVPNILVATQDNRYTVIKIDGKLPPTTRVWYDLIPLIHGFLGPK